MNRISVGRRLRAHSLSARLLGEYRVATLRRDPYFSDLRIFGESALSNTVVFDVGANVGNYALAAARGIGKGAVIALEPNPPVYEELVNSVRGTRVVPLNMACSDGNGWATLNVPVSDSGDLLAPIASIEPRQSSSTSSISEVRVRTIKLDDLVSGCQRVSVIKIDVEGHELSVLRGAEETLNRDRPVLLVEIEQRHLDGVGVADVVQWVIDHGYEASAVSGSGLKTWADFDVHEDQIRWLKPDGNSTVVVDYRRYLNNFLFSPSS